MRARNGRISWKRWTQRILGTAKLNFSLGTGPFLSMLVGVTKMKTGMKIWLWAMVTLTGLACMALPEFATGKPVVGDKVAVVNGSIITQEDLDREVNLVRQRLANMGRPMDEVQLSAIRGEVLETLIGRELLYQEGQNKGIKIKKERLEAEYEGLKKRFPSEKEFKSRLKSMNISEAEVKSQIERGLLIQELIDTQIAEKVNVPEKEVKGYYDSHPDSFKQPEQVRASHILMKVDPKADASQKAAARKKLEELRQRLVKGEDFVTLAREFSEGPSSVKGGDLGYFGHGQMVKPFEDVAFALNIGELSDVVETRFGYHLIKVTGKKPETIVAYADIKERLQQYLKDEKVRQEITGYVEELKTKAKVERFLKEK
jgi:peptidyl-prolyl cis-trans isomerase C